MGQLAEGLLSLSGWAALALLFTLPALEAPAFLGLVLPGELALLLGGVLAQQDRIPLVAALVVGVAGALAGDSIGYWIGHRWGPRLLTSGLGRRVGPARLLKVESLLLRGGGWALVAGRCTAGARVILPGLAGMLGLRYRTFALWTGSAATVWVIAHVLLGYAAGAGWRQVHHLSGRVGLLLGGAVLVTLAVAWLLHRLAGRHDDEPRQPVTSGGAATTRRCAVGRQSWVARGSEAPDSRAPRLLLSAACTRLQPAVTVSSSSRRLRGRG
jgi:membrane protein DedA with SNARE-associated domain